MKENKLHDQTTLETAATYNRQASRYAVAAARPMAQIRLATIQQTLLKISSSISKTAEIIDLGCGTGQSTETIRGIYKTQKIIGLDCSEAEAQIAQTRAKHCNLDIEYVVGDLFEHDFASKRFELVVAVMSIHYFQEQERLKQLLRRIHAILTDQGQLIVQIPNPGLPLPYRDYGIEHLIDTSSLQGNAEGAAYTVKLYESPLRYSEKEWGPALLSFTNFRHSLQTYQDAFESEGYLCYPQEVVIPTALKNEYTESHWLDFIKQPIYRTFIAKKPLSTDPSPA